MPAGNQSNSFMGIPHLQIQRGIQTIAVILFHTLFGEHGEKDGPEPKKTAVEKFTQFQLECISQMNRSSNRSDEQKLIRLRRSQKENEQIIEKQKKDLCILVKQDKFFRARIRKFEKEKQLADQKIHLHTLAQKNLQTYRIFSTFEAQVPRRSQFYMFSPA